MVRCCSALDTSNFLPRCLLRRESVEHRLPPFPSTPNFLFLTPFFSPLFFLSFFFELSFFSFLSRTSSQQQVARPGKRRRRKERKENEIRKGGETLYSGPFKARDGRSSFAPLISSECASPVLPKEARANEMETKPGLYSIIKCECSLSCKTACLTRNTVFSFSSAAPERTEEPRGKMHIFSLSFPFFTPGCIWQSSRISLFSCLFLPFPGYRWEGEYKTHFESRNEGRGTFRGGGRGGGEGTQKLN